MQLTETNQPPAANPVRDAVLRQQLLSRRERLNSALAAAEPANRLVSLLKDIDAALERMDIGRFGICDTCHESIESDRLLLDPLARNCMDHLSPTEQRALEMDLD